MLDGLDAIDWKSLKHARGSARNLPGFLRGLLAPDARSREEATFNLDYTLHDGGRVFSASPRVVPFLLELAQGEAVVERERALFLLANVAVGGTDARVTSGADMSEEATKKLFSRGPARDCHRLVLQGKPLFIELLAHADPRLRAAAAFVLAFLSDAAAEALPVARARLARETEPHARASLALAVGMLARHAHARDEEGALTDLLTHGSPLVAGSAAAGLSLIRRASLPPGAIDALRDLVPVGNVGRDRFPWCGGSADWLAQRFLQDLPGGDALAAEALAAAAVRRAGEKAPNDPLPRAWVGRALAIFFTPSASEDRLASELTAPQRALVETLSHADVDGPFDEHGLPGAAADRRRWLGVDPPGPLDEVVVVEHDGSDRAWPAWKSLRAASRGKLPFDTLARALAAALPARRLLDLYGDATLNVYGVWLPSREPLLAALEAAGAEGTTWAKELAEKILPRGEKAPADAAVACLLPLARADGVIDPRYDRLVRAALTAGAAPEVREILSALPVARREPLVVEMMRAVPNQAFALERGLPFADLCATESFAEVIAGYLVEVRRSSTPVEEGVAALVQMGAVAQGALARTEAALAATVRAARA